MLSGWRIRGRHWCIVTVHLLLIPIAYYLAFLLRFDFDLRLGNGYLRVFAQTLPAVFVTRAMAFGGFSLYRGWWRYVGIADLMAIFNAVTASSVSIFLLFSATGRVHGFPRSIFLLDWLTALLIFAGIRCAVRAFRERVYLLRPSRSGWGNRRQAVIVGAGSAGECLIRELRRGRDGHVVVPVAVLDDDPSKQGMRLHGVPIMGTTASLPKVCLEARADLVIVAIPSASATQMQRIMAFCRKARVRCEIVPSLPEILGGHAKISQTREVEVEDLLGRDCVELDVQLAAQQIEGKSVLVTGGAGSIGSELARQLAALRPKCLVLLDQAESPLYFVHLEITRLFPGVDVKPFVADVTDASAVSKLFSTHKLDFVFHAAAYKHVPLMESHLIEAIRNNVVGTLILAEHAALNEVPRFVLVSTDKAVRPSSVMGATKRIAERIILGWPSLVRSETDFRAVRFGNVLGSAGSVIPVFREQLKRGGPITVTHREVTRYFMTIPEASRLVLLAAVLPQVRGRIAMLEMGEPIRIADLADNLIQLSGLQPGVDIQVQFTGLRPGEKLYEELMSEVEKTVATPVSKIRVVQSTESAGEMVKASVARLLASVAMGDERDVLRLLGELVPECVAPLRDRIETASLMGASETSAAARLDVVPEVFNFVHSEAEIARGR